LFGGGNGGRELKVKEMGTGCTRDSICFVVVLQLCSTHGKILRCDAKICIIK
jgi:hypothetical protein